MLKFKNNKEKIRFINNLKNENNQTIVNLISTLFSLAIDKNTDVKEALAKQLVLFDCDEIEDILYTMLFDKNRMVRLEAVDSLSVGRKQKTIEKISFMIESEGQLVRMYAVMTLFDLITNVYGVNENAFEKYKELTDKSFRVEKNPRVLVAYYQNIYYMHRQEGLDLLKKIYLETMEQKRYDLLWTILHIFRDIQNKTNRSELEQIMEYKIGELVPAQKTFIDTMKRESVPQKVLILDNDNKYISHVVALILSSVCNKNDVIFDTAGVKSGMVLMDDIEMFCERNHISYPKKLYSKMVTEAYTYDSIICLNTKLEKNRYSQMIYYGEIDVKSDEQIMEVCKSIKEILRRKTL